MSDQKSDERVPQRKIRAFPLSGEEGLIFNTEGDQIGDNDSCFDFNFPIEAVRRLIYTCFVDLYHASLEYNVYECVSGSTFRLESLAYYMLETIGEELDRNGIDGKRVIDGVYSYYFKDAMEALEQRETHFKKAMREKVNRKM